jgi:ATP-binding protein involved in chromosome partitioning
LFSDIYEPNTNRVEGDKRVLRNIPDPSTLVLSRSHVNLFFFFLPPLSLSIQLIEKMRGVAHHLLEVLSYSSGAALSRFHATQAPSLRNASSLRQKLGGLSAVDNIIAVSSAKGGVGKSTSAVNLAVALASLSHKVGLLDADIHGPSIGKMMNLRGKPEISDNAPLLRPRENYRVKCMSFSFFMENEEQPAVLRGPMVNQAFDRMLYGTDWGELDYLIVDMPPGTGDAQINLGQRVPLRGAVIVSTPQDVALMDVKRGVAAYNMLRVPVLGFIENMAHHVCRACGHKEHTFGKGGVRRTAEEMGIALLGEVPLDAVICSRSDTGAPVVVSEPNGPVSESYIAMARSLKEVLDKIKRESKAGASAGPKIVIG